MDFLVFPLTCLNKAIIAGGVIPDILEAAPIVWGLMWLSFSTTSFDKLPTLEKSKFLGKLRFSSLLNKSMSSFCLRR